jgi:pyruvate/2-oxoglutarate dehydrogenase complex dihydrolipoamide acyltransferase (E2) component
LNYGPVAADGAVRVTLTFDHRVLDGGPAARALSELEAAMNELAAESPPVAPGGL